MEKTHKNIISKLDIPEACKYYWNYQFELGAQYLVNELRSVGAFKSGDTVTEIGCGEGGVVCSFVEDGAGAGFGTDIDVGRIKIGEIIAKELNLNIVFSEHDIINQEPAQDWKLASDLVILRDVIEHLDDAQIALANIKKIIKPNGFLYVTFPPFHSAFGGHQHITESFAGNFPYIHLLPKKLFYAMLGKNSKNIGEVERIHEIRLTPKYFIQSAVSAGYEVCEENYYLIRTVFKLKYGLPPIKLNLFKFLPFMKKYFALEASFLLRKK
ncbi:MAG: methyltransferase domain-containing protein [Bacteroidota bacterium]|jgi:SAM-dependent methyltransferase